MAAEWPQRVITFTRWPDAENVAVQHLHPHLSAATRLAQWSFLRKAPAWRLRFHPASTNAAALDRLLNTMVADGLVQRWTPGIYEPETTAFGGPAGMDLAHELFHHDSRQALTHLARLHTAPETAGLGCRELALLLPSVMMRGAGLDWFEQGDVWAKVAQQRPAPSREARRIGGAVQRLLTVDAGPRSDLIAGGRLAHLTDWLRAFEHAGQHLAHLNSTGALSRGLRAVTAHHVIFHWNRLGLPREHQGTLAHLAKEIIMGTSHNAASMPSPGPDDTSVTDVNTTTEPASPTDETLRNTLVDQLIDAGRVHTPRIEAALRTVPRHLFIPGASLKDAYANATVSIKDDANGTSISCASQPAVVGLMLEQLQPEEGEKILELGAGTGYNAGILAHLVGDSGDVTTIDVDDDLVDGARAHLEHAGIDNVTVLLGDGALGHPDGAPYDRIVATVGAHGIPNAWLDQLADGGHLVVPMRLRGSVCRSIAFERDGDVLRSVDSEMNTFMPLRRGIADDERRMIPLTSDRSVLLQTNTEQSVEPEALTSALAQPATTVWSGVSLRGMESPEWLELWLTCTMPNGLSRMPAQQQAIDRGVVSAPYPSSTAVFDKGALTYLTRRTSEHTAADGAALYEFGVIGHGPGGDELAERVAEQIRTWDRDFRQCDVSFELHPPEAALPPSLPGRFTIDTGLNQLVVDWQ
jgi:protein-L-isoaspartate(D-aspartate) O-methyltransferase